MKNKSKSKEKIDITLKEYEIGIYYTPREYNLDLVVDILDDEYYGYIWTISYSEDEKWGKKRNSEIVFSLPKKYNTPQDCIPDLEAKYFELTGIKLKVSLPDEGIACT